MRPMLRRAGIIGLIAGAAALHVSLVGVVETFQKKNVLADPIVTLGSMLPIVIALAAGYAAARPMRFGDELRRPGGAGTVVLGAIGGFGMALLLALLAFFIDTVHPRGVLVNASPNLVKILHFGLDVGPGTLLLLVGGAGLGVLGAAIHLLPRKVRGGVIAGLVAVLITALMQPFIATILNNAFLGFISSFLYARDGMHTLGAVVLFAAFAAFGWWRAQRPEGASLTAWIPPTRERSGLVVRGVIALVVVAFLLVLPQIAGIFLSEVLGTIGIYILLGLGLNIVVGFAGLLDLGYVAFFAVGAYTTAVLTSPASPAIHPELAFWLALPAVMVVAAAIGFGIGAPVLRLRGDYLAIVTLGFGEIARIIFLSDAMTPILGGAQGILTIPDPTPFASDPQSLYYPILAACAVAAVAAWSLYNSRVGRAWTAMREDETVAEATGISTTKYKLLAFALGATFGCVAGAFQATKIGSVFPQSLDILVSINALALIILGGIGSIPGVIVGAIVLVGLPELLREFNEYRLLIYGAVLIAMMLLKPEGLLPNRARRAELHEQEEQDEQWSEEAGAATPRPEVT